VIDQLIVKKRQAELFLGFGHTGDRGAAAAQLRELNRRGVRATCRD